MTDVELRKACARVAAADFLAGLESAKISDASVIPNGTRRDYLKSWIGDSIADIDRLSLSAKDEAKKQGLNPSMHGYGSFCDCIECEAWMLFGKEKEVEF